MTIFSHRIYNSPSTIVMFEKASGSEINNDRMLLG